MIAKQNTTAEPMRHGKSILRRYISAYNLFNSSEGNAPKAEEELYKLEAELSTLVDAHETLERARAIIRSGQGSTHRKYERLYVLLKNTGE